MGTEVLRPQDFLVDRFGVSPPAFHHRKSYFVNGDGFGSPKPNTYAYRKPANLNRPERQPDRKRKPTKDFQQQQRKPVGNLQVPVTIRRSPGPEVLVRTNGSKPVTNYHNPEVVPGPVAILRRGQSLDSFERNVRKDDSNNKSRKGSEKKVSLVGAGVYAGSATFVSPSPSSVPLPSFFSNKKIEYEDSATKGLRRLLGLQ